MDTRKENRHLLKHMVCAGLSGCITECIAMPIDTIKTRLMMDATRSVSFTKTLRPVVSALWKEGIRSFFKGLTPGLHRQIVFASTRIGLYDPVPFVMPKKTFDNLSSVDEIPLWDAGT